MSNAFVPIGSQLKIGDQHSGETFTAISEVNRISGLGWTRDVVETTNLDTTGGYRTWLPTFRDGETITIDMNMTVANWDQFRDIFETQDEENESWDFQIVLKAGAVTKYTWEFQAFIIGLKLGDISFDDKQSMSVDLKITGAPTETSGGA
jgi:hypothetical protein